MLLEDGYAMLDSVRAARTFMGDILDFYDFGCDLPNDLGPSGIAICANNSLWYVNRKLDNLLEMIHHGTCRIR